MRVDSDSVLGGIAPGVCGRTGIRSVSRETFVLNRKRARGSGIRSRRRNRVRSMGKGPVPREDGSFSSAAWRCSTEAAIRPLEGAGGGGQPSASSGVEGHLRYRYRAGGGPAKDSGRFCTVPRGTEWATCQCHPRSRPCARSPNDSASDGFAVTPSRNRSWVTRRSATYRGPPPDNAIPQRTGRTERRRRSLHRSASRK